MKNNLETMMERVKRAKERFTDPAVVYDRKQNEDPAFPLIVSFRQHPRRQGRQPYAAIIAVPEGQTITGRRRRCISVTEWEGKILLGDADITIREEDSVVRCEQRLPSLTELLLEKSKPRGSRPTFVQPPYGTANFLATIAATNPKYHYCWSHASGLSHYVQTGKIKEVPMPDLEATNKVAKAILYLRQYRASLAQDRQ